MDIQFSFDATGIATFIGWALLCAAVFVPSTNGWHRWPMLIAGRLIPISLVIWFVVSGFAASMIEPRGDMFTLEGVLARFSVPDRLLVLWIEVLAYDLFLGRWIADDARARGWPPILILPLLPLTFIRGPLGLLIYLMFVGLSMAYSQMRRLRS